VKKIRRKGRNLMENDEKLKVKMDSYGVSRERKREFREREIRGLEDVCMMSSERE